MTLAQHALIISKDKLQTIIDGNRRILQILHDAPLEANTAEFLRQTAISSHRDGIALAEALLLVIAELTERD